MVSPVRYSHFSSMEPELVVPQEQLTVRAFDNDVVGVVEIRSPGLLGV